MIGLTTILQTRRIGAFGAGHVLIMGTSGAFIAVCVTALAESGPGMLVTLVFLLSLMQFVLARRLSLLRRILTPAVTGTVIMMIPVTVMPIVFDMLADVPDHVEPQAADLVATRGLSASRHNDLTPFAKGKNAMSGRDCASALSILRYRVMASVRASKIAMEAVRAAMASPRL